MRATDEVISMRLNDGCVPVTESGCWLWVRSCDTTGYGLVTVATGKSGSAHREAYRIARGPIPPGHVVCHRCDTRSCINPDHLFVGTQRENMRDASRKGRIASSLTLDQAREVRQSKESVLDISARMGVGTHVIYKCRRGDTYPQLLEEGQ